MERTPGIFSVWKYTFCEKDTSFFGLQNKYGALKEQIIRAAFSQGFVVSISETFECSQAIDVENAIPWRSRGHKNTFWRSTLPNIQY